MRIRIAGPDSVGRHLAVDGEAPVLVYVDSAWQSSGVTAVTASIALITVEIRMVAKSYSWRNPWETLRKC